MSVDRYSEAEALIARIESRQVGGVLHLYCQHRSSLHGPSTKQRYATGLSSTASCEHEVDLRFTVGNPTCSGLGLASACLPVETKTGCWEKTEVELCLQNSFRLGVRCYYLFVEAPKFLVFLPPAVNQARAYA